MNLFIHGLDGNIQLGNSYTDDGHATLKADYVLANPPFNDGSEGENGWGSDKIADKDLRKHYAASILDFTDEITRETLPALGPALQPAASNVVKLKKR